MRQWDLCMKPEPVVNITIPDKFDGILEVRVHSSSCPRGWNSILYTPDQITIDVTSQETVLHLQGTQFVTDIFDISLVAESDPSPPLITASRSSTLEQAVAITI